MSFSNCYAACAHSQMVVAEQRSPYLRYLTPRLAKKCLSVDKVSSNSAMQDPQIFCVTAQSLIRERQYTLHTYDARISPSISARTPCSSAASRERKLFAIENSSSRLEYALCTVPYATLNMQGLARRIRKLKHKNNQIPGNSC